MTFLFESDSEEEQEEEDEVQQEALPQQLHSEDLEIDPSSSIEQLCQPNGFQIVNEFPKILERLQSCHTKLAAAAKGTNNTKPFLRLVEAVGKQPREGLGNW